MESTGHEGRISLVVHQNPSPAHAVSRSGPLQGGGRASEPAGLPRHAALKTLCTTAVSDITGSLRPDHLSSIRLRSLAGRSRRPRRIGFESSGDYGTLLHVDALDAAQHVVAERFPDALAAILAGSAGTALQTATSDLDIVVFLGGPPAPFRETIRYAGWTVELFVQTATSYPRFIERETNNRRSPLLHMCGEGRLLIDADGFGATLQDQARHLIEAGPTPLTNRERDGRRYGLTDLLDDLVGCQDDDELVVIGARLLTWAAELALLERRRWIGHGKWLLRRLRGADPSLAHELIDAYRCLVARSDPRPLERIARRVLDQSGGPLMEGYHQAAALE